MPPVMPPERKGPYPPSLSAPPGERLPSGRQWALCTVARTLALLTGQPPVARIAVDINALSGVGEERLQAGLAQVKSLLGEVTGPLAVSLEVRIHYCSPAGDRATAVMNPAGTLLLNEALRVGIPAARWLVMIPSPNKEPCDDRT